MMIRAVISLLGIASISISACMQSEQGNNQKGVESDWTADDQRTIGLLKTNCTSCHHPNRETVIAPGLQSIRQQYLDAYKNEEAFIDGFTRFVKNPSNELSIIPGAIEKYGAMPRPNLTDADLQAIALFLYRHNPIRIQ